MSITAQPFIRHETVDGRLVTYIRFSANSLGMFDRCPRALWYYKVLFRKPVGAGSGLIAGLALHEAAPIWKRGGSFEEQDKAIDAMLAKYPPIVASEREYRTPAYIRDAWAAFRPELDRLFAHWAIDEIEKPFVVELGQTRYRQQDGAWAVAHVEWEGRRDLVGVDPYGDRWVVDWKSSSRDEDAAVKAYKNSGQFIGYLHSWRVEHQDKPVKGVQPVRLVMRKPSKSGVAYTIPPDGPVTFGEERIDEWVRHTLRKARDILERDPANPDDWPLACAELGCCRHTFGCCEYIGVCTLDPHERALKLSTDEFEPSDAGKHRDASNGE